MVLVSGNGPDSASYTLQILAETPHVHFDTLPPHVFEAKTFLVTSEDVQEQIRRKGVCFAKLHGNALRQGYLVPSGEEHVDVLLETDIPWDLNEENDGDDRENDTNNGENRKDDENEKTDRSGETCANEATRQDEYEIKGAETSKNEDFSCAETDVVFDPDAWKIDVELSQHETPENLKGFMAPPDKNVPAIQQSPINEKSPREFLQARYYGILYQLKMPLSYFPKTALPRLKNMCVDAETRAETLLHMFLLVDEFARAQNRFRELASGESAVVISEVEKQNQQKYVLSYLADANDDNVANIVLQLKIREAQLQILVLLELVLAQNLDEALFLAPQPVLPEKKRSLVRKKGKRIVPTLLGLAVPALLQKEPLKTDKKGQILPETLQKALLSLIDQIGLWDSLLGRKNGLDENTHGFLAHVIVPYFNKSLPLVVPHIIKAFKSLRPKLKPVKKRAEEKRTEEKRTEEKSPPAKKPKFAKQLLSADQISLLHRALSSGLQDLQPAFLLKRSKSNLGGSKDLIRRQVDMSVSKNETDVKLLFLFADARKMKLENMLMNLAVHSNLAMNSILNLMEVQATPRKAQVMATPSNARVVDMHCVQDTPVASVHERLAQARDEIQSSPVASPARTPRVRPGQRISMQDSPFYKYSEESPFYDQSRAERKEPKRAKLVRKGDEKARAGDQREGDESGNTTRKSMKGKPQNRSSRGKVSNGSDSEAENRSRDLGHEGANLGQYSAKMGQNNAKMGQGDAMFSSKRTDSTPGFLGKRTDQFNQLSSLSEPNIEFSLLRQDTVLDQTLTGNLENSDMMLDMTGTVQGSENSDTDSDYERLLAASKPVVRKYTKRR